MFNTKKFNNLKCVSLYGVSENIDVAFTNETISNTFGKYLADLEFKQARIAESDKYQYVTYYFDGAEDITDKNMYKMLIPSAKVPRFDMKPEMSAGEVTEAVLSAMEEDFDFILVNYANADALGHTGNIPACIRSLESIDVCIGHILEKAQENFYDLVITSDHGNIEYMKDENGNIITKHTDNRVPFIICNENYKLREEGTLQDVIPTLIDIYEISKPKEMTGESLLIKENTK